MGLMQPCNTIMQLFSCGINSHCKLFVSDGFLQNTVHPRAVSYTAPWMKRESYSESYLLLFCLFIYLQIERLVGMNEIRVLMNNLYALNIHNF